MNRIIRIASFLAIGFFATAQASVESPQVKISPLTNTNTNASAVALRGACICGSSPSYNQETCQKHAAFLGIISNAEAGVVLTGSCRRARVDECSGAYCIAFEGHAILP